MAAKPLTKDEARRMAVNFAKDDPDRPAPPQKWAYVEFAVASAAGSACCSVRL